MATQNPVLFMSTKTPGNFKGKRQQEEIRALALRAASFSRPNRKKAKKVIPKDATSISSEGVSPVSETSSTVKRYAYAGRTDLAKLIEAGNHSVPKHPTQALPHMWQGSDIKPQENHRGAS